MALHVPADRSTTIPDPAPGGASAGEQQVGSVVLVGGGPGDPDLLTVGGLRALQHADVVLYDHLAPLACLDDTKPGATLIDVRTPAEHEAGSIPGALLFPLDDLRDRADELPDGRLVAHCAVGIRGHTAVRLLTQLGRDVANLDGGYKTWRAATAG